MLLLFEVQIYGTLLVMEKEFVAKTWISSMGLETGSQDQQPQIMDEKSSWSASE